MGKFKSGNVVKLATGSLVIIVRYRHIESNTWPNNPEFNYPVCDYVYVNHSNMSGCSRVETVTKTEQCSCSLVNGRPIEDCEDCNGTGSYEHTDYGMDRAELVASNVKSWITDTLTNKFNF